MSVEEIKKLGFHDLAKVAKGLDIDTRKKKMPVLLKEVLEVYVDPKLVEEPKVLLEDDSNESEDTEDDFNESEGTEDDSNESETVESVLTQSEKDEDVDKLKAYIALGTKAVASVKDPESLKAVKATLKAHEDKLAKMLK